MFANLLREHQEAQEANKALVNYKRVLAEDAVEQLTGENVKQLNEGISQAYLNQHKLDSEIRKLQDNVSKLTKQAQQWMTIGNSLNSAVKDLGDISTWTKTIENDVKFITKSIEESYRIPTEES